MKVFSVSQNDTDYHCECPECAKDREAEGSQMGPSCASSTRRRDIKTDYPDVAIET